MMVPRPALEPISSAANSTTKACASPMRMPANSCGAVAGMTTRKKIVAGGVPILRADQIKSRSTDNTAWREATNTGKKRENAMIANVDAWQSPNKSMKVGRNETLGMEERKETS